MLGHIAGRPSPSWDKIQAIVVLLMRYILLFATALFLVPYVVWRTNTLSPLSHPNSRSKNSIPHFSNSYVALRKVPAAGPRPFQRLHNLLKKYTPWQILIGALTTLYAAHHADLLLGLTPAEPEKKMVLVSLVLFSPLTFPSPLLLNSIASLVFHAYISCIVPPLSLFLLRNAIPSCLSVVVLQCLAAHLYHLPICTLDQHRTFPPSQLPLITTTYTPSDPMSPITVLA